MPKPTAKPAAPAAPELAAQGDASAVTTDDIRAALGIPPKGAKSSAPAADDSADDEAGNLSAFDAAQAAAAEQAAATETDDDLTDEERAAAEAELAAASDDAPEASAEGDADDPAAAPAPATAELTEKLTAAEAAKAAAEQEAATLRERLAAREAAEADRTDAGVIDAITDPEQLSAHRTRMVNLYAWAVRHPDGGDLPDGKGGSVALSREEVTALQADAFQQVQDLIPRRERFLATAAQREAEAINTYPWLKETARGLGAEAAKLLQQAPGLRRLPEHRLVAADAALGARLRAAGVKLDEATLGKMLAAAKAAAPAASAQPGTAARPAAPRVPPSAAARPGVVPPRVRGAAVAQATASKAMRASKGHVRDVAASIAAKLGR